jgi:nitric oxide reductase activation protein
MFNCNGDLNHSKSLEMEKKLNKNNNQVTVFVDVSYATDNFDEVKRFIKNEQCPLFF